MPDKKFIMPVLSIREARNDDLKAIMAVLEAAKGIMRASGNTGQWVNGYPSEEVVLNDISQGYGFGYCGIIYLASGDERLAYQLCMRNGKENG